MAQYPFSPEGVQDLLLELYALSDIDLHNESDALQGNIVSWVSLHFDLTLDQENYLVALDPTFLAGAAQEISITIRNRQKLRLEPLPFPPKKSSKVFEYHRIVLASYDPGKTGEGSTRDASELILTFYYTD